MIKATEDGDTVRFERPGPFGTVQVADARKSELDEREQAAGIAREAAAAKQE